MKYLYTSLFILFICSFIYSQEGFVISEKDDTTICGKILIVDGIWVSGGITKADISMLDKPNSKAITGGYKKGDIITISDLEGCAYYITSITKSGTASDKGAVELSKEMSSETVPVCEETLNWQSAQSYLFHTFDYNISSIFTGENGTVTAEIKISQKTNYIRSLYLKKGDHVWLTECLYKVEDILHAAKETPDYILLKRQHEYLF